MTARRVRVLIDCDGILSGFVDGALRTIERVLGRKHTSEEVTIFDFCKALNIIGSDRRRVMDAIGEETQFARKLPILPGAREGVRRLQEIAEVHVVTSPWNSHPTWTHDREAWLREFFGIEHKFVHHSSAKYLFDGDVFIDDRVGNVEAWHEAHPRGTAALWVTTHNRLEVAETSLPCTSSWDQVLTWVTERAARQTSFSGEF